MFQLPDHPAGTTLYLPFDTYDSAGASVTITGLAVTDIEIYKNGSVTQRSSDNGYALLDTDGIDFDSSTGLHGFSIDLTDNSDSGFYAAGAQYWIHVNAITCDSQTIKLTYRVRLVAAESVAGSPKVDVAQFGGTNLTASGGRPEVKLGNVAHGGAAATLDIDVATIGQADFGAISGTFTGSIGSLGAQAKADVNAEVDAAIETYHLDHLLAVAYDPSAKPGHAEGLLNELVENDGGVSRFTANALEQAPSVSAATIADAVWDEARAGHVAAGSFGEYVPANVTYLGNSLVSEDSIANWHTFYHNDSTVSTREIDHIVPLDKMQRYVGLLARKDAALASDAATELGEINTNWGSGAGAYVSTTDSQEATRDRGDAAWATATGFSTHSATDVWAAATRTLTAGTNIVLAKGTGVTGFNDIAAGAAMTLTSDERNSIADALLSRSVTNVQDSADVHSLCSIILATLESSTSGTTWTIRKTGGTTFTTKTLTVDASADPITGVT